MHKRIIVGIDQSYSKTGIAIVADNKIIKLGSIDFKGCKNNTDKRNLIKYKLTHILKKVSQMGHENLIICERIRTFSGGFLSANYLKSTGALIATLVDVAYEFNIPVYSVDTRSWKSKIIGSSKADKSGNKKGPTIKFIEKLGFDVSYKTKRGKIKYNDDSADAGCIGLYGFLPKSKQNLKLEK